MYSILVHKAQLKKFRQLKDRLRELSENVQESEMDVVFTPQSSRLLTFIGLLHEIDLKFKLLT